jgi:HD-GYP domain-containing protein (c-di-GMP phosphodiesterase class II)
VTNTPPPQGVFAELLFPLTFASDLNMGLSIEHTLRTVWVSMQMADHLMLSHDDKVALYYGGLLKDSG